MHPPVDFCKELMNRIPSTQVKYLCRERDRCADALA